MCIYRCDAAQRRNKLLEPNKAEKTAAIPLFEEGWGKKEKYIF